MSNNRKLDLQAEKKYITDIEADVRKLELEKVKLDQQKEYAQNAIDESLKKMDELGFTPETIDDGIEKIYGTIVTLKSKINKLLGAEEEEDEKDDDEIDYPF